MSYRYKIIVSIVILIIMCVILTSCKNPITSLFDKNDDAQVEQEQQQGLDETMQEQEGLRSTVLYYQDKYGYLVPVMRKIPWEEGIAKKAISALVDDPIIREEAAEMGLYPTLPEATEVIGMAIKPDLDNLARVDFNKNIMNYTSAAEENCIVQSIVYTLTEFPTIDQVEFMIEGKKVDQLTYGTDVSKPLTRQMINLESDNYIQDDRLSRVTVYFYNDENADYEYFVPVTKIVSSLEPNIETAIEQLIEGPNSDSVLKSGIPEGTKLLGVQIKDGVAYINFSQEFNQLEQDQESRDKTIKNIVLTAKQFADIKEAKILVEGEQVTDTYTVPAFANQY